MTPPDSGEREPNLPCPHGRASWHHCPHCLGLNAPVPDMVITSDVNESAVVISKALAQRILAALEDSGVWTLVDELRACVERKT